MLKYQFFPRSVGISEEIKNVVKCFELVYDEIKSPENNLDSDGVLKKISPYLQALNFQVEISKKKKIKYGAVEDHSKYLMGNLLHVIIYDLMK
jgi:hypothetical protein